MTYAEDSNNKLELARMLLKLAARQRRTSRRLLYLARAVEELEAIEEFNLPAMDAGHR